MAVGPSLKIIHCKITVNHKCPALQLINSQRLGSMLVETRYQISFGGGWEGGNADGGERET